jgi:acetyl esterase/lipase
MISWLFLVVSLWGAWFTYNAYRPSGHHPRLSIISFFAGWFTTELALHHIVWQAVCTVLFVWLGALEHWPGKLGLAITLASWVGLARCFLDARGVTAIVDHALAEGLGPDWQARIRPELAERLSPDVDWRQLMLPMPLLRPGVERVRDVVYGRVRGINLRLDVYHGSGKPSGCPVLFQIHGGAWILGSKNEQGLPLMHRLAANGWVCVSVDYRLSPHATFPDHLIDLKRALAWVRAHIAEYGGDPDMIIATGGSAGGHLCALVGLTANDPRYQPGFEDADTSVKAAVPFYGVYDFTNRYGVWRHGGMQDLLERQVMKASLEEDPELYQQASPMSCITADAPPFFVVHGTHDTLVPVEEARRFCALFREHARAPLCYVELPGAQHAFEIFPSLRTALVLHGVERFLAWVVSTRGAAGTAASGAARSATG